MAALTRDELDAALWKGVNEAQAFVIRAQQEVDDSPLRTSVFGDRDAWRTLSLNAQNLTGRVMDLAAKVAGITSKRTEDITQRELENVGVLTGLIKDEAAALMAYSADVATWHDLMRATIREFIALVIEAAKEVGEAAGTAAAGVLDGLTDGLGPVGTLVLLFVAFHYFEGKASS